MKDAASGTPTIRLQDGRSLSHTITQARGAPSSPLSDQDLGSKFRDCASYARPVPPKRIVEQLTDSLLSITSAPVAADAFNSLQRHAL